MFRGATLPSLFCQALDRRSFAGDGDAWHEDGCADRLHDRSEREDFDDRDVRRFNRAAFASSNCNSDEGKHGAGERCEQGRMPICFVVDGLCHRAVGGASGRRNPLHPRAWLYRHCPAHGQTGRISPPTAERPTRGPLKRARRTERVSSWNQGCSSPFMSAVGQMLRRTSAT